MCNKKYIPLLIHSYDLIGGNFLVWSNQAKIAPPPLYATLRLQHISEEGWQILQEIKALGAWAPREKKAIEPKKSRRKQSKVRHIVVRVEQEKESTQDESEENDNGENIPEGSHSRQKEDEDYQMQSDEEEDSDEDYTPEKVYCNSE